jgi:hypothetical protein
VAIVCAVRIEAVVHVSRQARPWPSDADAMSPSTSILGSNLPPSPPSDMAFDRSRSTLLPSSGPSTPADRTGNAEPRDRSQSHDGVRGRLRLRLSVSTQETMRSFAGARGVSQAGLLDALLHGLESADPDWLRGVIEQARRNDTNHQSGDATSAPGSHGGLVALDHPGGDGRSIR